MTKYRCRTFSARSCTVWRILAEVPILPRVSAPANASVPTRDAKCLGVGANGRHVSQGRFRVVGCGAFRLGFDGAFRLDFDGGLGGEAEETALFLPVMRQVFAESQQPDRRQLNGMSTCE
jgi:hypothetical protein